MSDHDTPHIARRRRLARVSPIWLVPLAAVLIGLWLAVNAFSHRGPRIVLEMESAEGIEAGSTLIRALNVEVGVVETVELADDLSHTHVAARMNPGTEGLLADDTLFWVVKPRVGREGISGLGTVLSGAYIELRPGEGQAGRRRFEVLEQPPLTPAGAEGLHVTLEGDVANSLRVGDPVSFQGLTVGRVEEASFDATTRRMRHRLFIESPYDSLVTENTRFWTAGGVDLQLDAQGFRVSVESLEALLIGGVTFGYLEGVPVGAPASEDSRFILFPDEESARQDSFSRFFEYVLLIDGSVRGLSAGAPVEFRGVRVGTVAAVPWTFDLPQADAPVPFAAVPVLIRLEPERLAATSGAPQLSLEHWVANFDALLQRGLTASLKTGNLLTGALFVDLNFGAPLVEGGLSQTYNGLPVLPSSGGGFAQLEAQLASLLDKLNGLQIEPVLERLESNLSASEAMLGELRAVAQSLQAVLDSPGVQALPESLGLALDELRGTLEGFAPDSAPYADLERTLQGLDSLLRELQPMARTLSEQPNALIFDRRGGADPEPRAREGD